MCWVCSERMFSLCSLTEKEIVENFFLKSGMDFEHVSQYVKFAFRTKYYSKTKEYVFRTNAPNVKEGFFFKDNNHKILSRISMTHSIRLTRKAY